MSLDANAGGVMAGRSVREASGRVKRLDNEDWALPEEKQAFALSASG